MKNQLSQMKSTYMFRDQVGKMTSWFKAWNECEQTVALYSLLRKINATQGKFLVQVLDQRLGDCSDVQSLETKANNPGYIRSLCNESKEHAVAQLLRSLPLLRPGNPEAKAEYLQIIPRILTHSIDNSCHIEESRQLLSYSLIHPALSSEERSHFTVWLGHLEERSSPCNNANNHAHLNQHNFQHYQQQQQSSSSSSLHGSSELIHGTDALPKNAQDLLGQYLDKNNGAVTYNNPVSSSWHQSLGSRDSGIGIGCPDSGSDGPNVNGLNNLSIVNNVSLSSTNNGSGPVVGRAITSSAALNTSNHCNVGNVANNGNCTDYISLHSSGTTNCGEHIALHPIYSGPIAFSTALQPGIGQQPCTSVGSAHRKLTRSASVTPPLSVPTSHVSDWLNKHHDEMSLSNSRPQSRNTSEMHAPLSPQSSVTSSGSGSDNQPDDGHRMDHPAGVHQHNTFMEEGSGMRDVPIWLKSLRLHKYSSLFQTMTYERMMNLDEVYLESQGVTKGARNKIVLSVRKLRERQNALRAMEKEIMESGNLKQALAEVKAILNTPIKCYVASDIQPNNPTATDAGSSGISADSSPSGDGERQTAQDCGRVGVSGTDADSNPEGDLPGQITRVLGKLCTQLLVTTHPEEECFSMYLHLLDKCMFHEAFTLEQKKKMSSWKQQIQKIWHPNPQKFGLDRQRKGFGNTFPPNPLLRGGQRALRGVQQQMRPGQPKWTFTNHPTVTITGNPIVATPGMGGISLYRNNSFNTAFNVHQAMLEVKQPITRTHSAPIKSTQFGVNFAARPVSTDSAISADSEISAALESGLESLCLSMTEHALGSFGDAL